MQFQKATKRQSRLRLALIGPSGSGKTYSALAIGQSLGSRMALIDTERGSASKYADLFEFDTLDLTTFSPLTYVEAIKVAESAGYDVLVIDSLSHAWMGKEGALEQVDRAAKRSQSNNTYTAWRDVTPMHNALIDAMLQSQCHIIVTMRAKTEYVLEENERGKKVPRKVGMAPVQRDGMEYEFDVVADMTPENDFVVSKSRCPAMTGQVINKPGKQVAETLKAWLSDGAPAPAAQPAPAAPQNGNGTHEQPAATKLRQEPETLKANLLAVAGKMTKPYAQPQDSQSAAAVLEHILGGKAQRKELLQWLYGKNSMSRENPAYIGDANVLALTRWLKPAYDRASKQYAMDPDAEREARAAHAYVLGLNGQGVLLEV